MSAAVRRPRLSPWAWLVTGSAVVVVGVLAALLVGGLASSRERLVSFAVAGELDGVALDLGEADVDVVRGAGRPTVRVERRERFAFGHGARIERALDGGVLSVRSRCPSTVLRSCSVSYRLMVADNIPVAVRTGGGDVRFDDYRGSARVASGSGDIDVRNFCGYSLQARSETGAVAAAASCPPPQLSLRSTSGDVRVEVPEGRYEVDAGSASGGSLVRDVTEVSDAPFSLEALSSSGDVLVEGRP